MKICDICRQVVTHLESGPPEMKPSEICEICQNDLLMRFSAVEKQVAETRQRLRREAVMEWRLTRTPKQASGKLPEA